MFDVDDLAAPDPRPADAAPPEGAAAAAEEPPPTAMAEIDLLPDWYAKFVRRRARVRWQAAVTVGLLVAMGVILILRREHVAESRGELAHLVDRRRVTDVTLDRLGAEEARLAKLSGRAAVLSRVGLPLEVTRVLADVQRAMAATTTVVSLEATTESATPSATDVAVARKRGLTPPGPTKLLRFKLDGLAENSLDATRFYEALRDNALFRRDETTLQFKSDQFNGKAVSSFTIVFVVDLLPDGMFEPDAGGK